MKTLILFSVFILNITLVISQSIFTNPITGTNPNTSNPYITGQVVDANISVSGIGRGPGVTGSNANDRYNATGWNAVSIDLNDYFEFTLTPTVGCEIDFTSFVYVGAASGTGPTSFAIRSSLDGYVANIGTPSAAGTTIGLGAAAYQNVTSAITFRFYGWGASAAGGTFSINSFTFNGSTAFTSTTITTGAVTGGPFAVDCSTSDLGTVAFTSTGTFNVGNIFTVQLSNAAGSFVSPISIGTLSGVTAEGLAPSATIPITIPAGIPSGSGYLIRIISSNPATIGTNSATQSITLTGPCVYPYMTSVIINSCNPTCTEGHNELVFGSTADYSVLANAANIVLRYENVNPPTVTYTDGFVTVPATTSAINTSAGCTVVQEGLGATMPPNSNFVIVRSTMCVDALDWSSLCGFGTIYILYSTDASWTTGGNFVNGAAGMRYFRTAITTTYSNVNTVDYSYNSNLLLNSDGEFVTYGPSGGSPLLYGDDNCVLNPVLLPTSLLSFTGKYINNISELTWQIASEQNNSHFTLFHSINGTEFNTIGIVTGAGNSSELKNYRFNHSFPQPGINYYKLQSTDYDGKTYNKGIIALEAIFNFSFYNSITSTIELKYESDIEIYSLDGKLIQSALNTSSIPFYKSGMFYILDKKTGISERLFIP